MRTWLGVEEQGAREEGAGAKAVGKVGVGGEERPVVGCQWAVGREAFPAQVAVVTPAEVGPEPGGAAVAGLHQHPRWTC